jgi:RHS repeat-associated protein
MSGNLIAEADSTNVISRYFIHGAGLLAMVTSDNSLYCYHFDATGHTVALTNSGKTMVNKYAYTPFGIIAGETEAIPQPFKYAGQHGVMAESNGLYYMRARFYDPAVKRFISEDPLGFNGGDLNLYAYVGNNPVMGVDPWGLCAESPYKNPWKGLEFGVKAAGVVMQYAAVTIIQDRAIDFVTGSALKILPLKESAKIAIDVTIDKARKINSLVDYKEYQDDAHKINNRILEVRKQVFNE